MFSGVYETGNYAFVYFLKVESDNLFITLNTIQVMTLKHVDDWKHVAAGYMHRHSLTLIFYSYIQDL